MLEHKLIAKVKIKTHAKETYQIALVETATDYVIAHYYHGKHDSWGNGDYMPKELCSPAGALTNFASVIASEAKSPFTASINF